MNLEGLKGRFASTFGRVPSIALRAPGRVNLIGEHTDYNDGFVLPIAINWQMLAVAADRKDRRVTFASAQVQTNDTIDLESEITQLPRGSWTNYCRGVAAGLLAAGLSLRGVDILFDSDIPLGGGLSSSAALEVATALTLLAVAGLSKAVGGMELARLCQKAEHDFAGAPCGIMDQAIVTLARSGCAMLLDCRSNRIRHVPFNDPGVVLLVADTQVKHAISDGGYAHRRDQCLAAAAKLGVRALRDADAASVASAAAEGKLAGKELMRARHVVGEITRTLQAAEALSAGNYARFGELMYDSHASLRDDYEVSCDELDAIVESARRCRGVFGARMTGGGFGGCAIILAKIDQADEIAEAVQKDFAARFGRSCPIFATAAASGASILE